MTRGSVGKTGEDVGYLSLGAFELAFSICLGVAGNPHVRSIAYDTDFVD